MNEDLNEFPDSPVDGFPVDESLDSQPEFDDVTNAIENMGGFPLSNETSPDELPPESIESENTENNEFGEAVGESEITTEEAPDDSDNVDTIAEDDGSSVPSDEIEPDVTVTEEIPTTPSDTIEEPVLEDDFIESEGSLIGTPDLGGRFNPHGKAVEENKKTFKDIFTDVLAKVKVSLGLDEETLQAKREEREARNIARQAKAAVKKSEEVNDEELDDLTKMKIDALTTALFDGRDGENSELTFRNMANMAVNLVGQSSTNVALDKVLENVVNEFQNTKSAKQLKDFDLLNVASAIELSKKLGECKNPEEILNSTAERLYGIKVEGIGEKHFSVIGLANAEVEKITIPQEICGKELWNINLSHEYSDAQNLKTIDISELDCFTWYNAAELLYLRTSSDMEQFVMIKYNDEEVSLAKIRADVDNLNTTFGKSNIYMQDEPEPGYFDSTLYTKGSPSFLYTESKLINIPSTICDRNVVVKNDFFQDYKNLEEIQITAPDSMKNDLETALETHLSNLRKNGNEIGNVNVTVDYGGSRITYGFSKSGNLTMEVESDINRAGRLEKERAELDAKMQAEIAAEERPIIIFPEDAPKKGSNAAQSSALVNGFVSGNNDTSVSHELTAAVAHQGAQGATDRKSEKPARKNR